MKKAEREEIWQIITHLAGLGLNVKSYTVEGEMLSVNIHVPILNKQSGTP
jgi:hypothetical protein